MSFISKHLKNIISANNDNRLAIFIGAGFSKHSETTSIKLPDWNDLIFDLKKELELDNNAEHDYLKIAQLYYLAFGEHTYYKKLKAFFPDYIKPSQAHKLIFELNPHIIITTNWDTILEKAVEENAYIYDTICSDTDLVKSSLQKKLIKMHGDFKNHNIIFKEDDFINYQHDFPLIENYIKSILSTHTVLFFGYSYNDINLKQIMKWLQNHSKVRPPMYLTTFKENTTQIKYLENHGITTLLMEKLGNDNYLQRTLTFLNRIKNYDNSFIINSDSDTIDFIYSKLNGLNGLDGILVEQIQKALSNCEFFYDADKPILEFHNNIGTFSDNTKTHLSIYKRFVEILKRIDKGEPPDHKLIKIFEILSKANIKGVMISDTDIQSTPKEYIPILNYIDKKAIDSTAIYFDFDFNGFVNSSNEISDLLEFAYKNYQLSEYEKVYSILEEVITACLKQRNYTLLFIAMFNKNVMLRRIKYSLNPNIRKDKYLNIQEYNLKEKLNELPKDLQLALEPVYNFIDFSFIYQYAYTISKELKSKEDSKETIMSGGFVYSADFYKLPSKHENFILFVLRNKLMIEYYAEFFSINKDFVNISIVRQAQNESTLLNKVELFSCIKYIKNKDLKILLKEFYSSESDKKGKMQISDENKAWLINVVFENIVDIYIESNPVFNKIEPCVENLIFILSLVKLTEQEIEKVFKLILKLVKDAKIAQGVYESINLFIGIQYGLYKTEINKEHLLSFIENIINKFVYKKSNGYEYRALTRNEIPNLYWHAKNREAIFKNKNLIEKLLVELKTLPISDKIDFCQSLLLNIYHISDETIKGKIKAFMLKIDSTKEKELYKHLIFEFALIINDFKTLSSALIKSLNEYLKQFEDKSFSSILYTLDAQIDYLIKEKKLVKQLKEYSDKIKLVINRHKESGRFSIF